MTLLRTQNLSAFYGDFQALFGIDVTVEQGETVAIIGANGAGKTTLLRTIAGALATAPEAVLFDGSRSGTRRHMKSCGSASPWCRRAAGCFKASRSKKTCCLAPIASAPGRGISARVYELFPRLQ